MSKVIVIPPGWRIKSFGKVCKMLVNGGTPDTTNPRFWDGLIPWITGADFGTYGLTEFRRHVSDVALRATATNMVRKGNLLIVTRTGVGKLAIAPCDIAISQDITGVYPDDAQVDVSYLHFLMVRGTEQLKKLNQGTSINGITRRDLENLSVLIPDDLSEQRQIARILWSVSEVISSTDTLITKYEKIKIGLMHDLFTRGLDANGQLRRPRGEAPELYQESALGWIPRAWETSLLDSIAQRGSGHTPNRNHPEYWDGGIKWISLADCPKLDDLYISETQFNISKLGILNSSAVLHPPGVVVLSRDAGVGKSAITTEPMAVSQHFMCWLCSASLNNHFLYYWLQYHKRSFENIATGSTIPTIGLPFFRKYQIARPSLVKEQEQIASCLAAIDQCISATREELKKLRNLRLGLSSDLLDGKVRVIPEKARVTHV